jgi:hypothetical protein
VGRPGDPFRLIECDGLFHVISVQISFVVGGLLPGSGGGAAD